MKNREKTTCLVTGVLIGLFGMAASVGAADSVLAGWDRSNDSNPSHTEVGFSGSSIWGGETNGVSVNLWVNEFSRYDNDGTFGSLAYLGAVDLARSWKLGTPNGLSSSIHYLEYTLVNGGTDEYELSYFSFDALRVNSSPDFYRISMTGALGSNANITSGTFPKVGLPSSNSDYPDYDISLAGLADNTLAPGESVTFRLEFTDTNPSLGSSLYIDNVAFLGGIYSPLTQNVITISIKTQ